MYKIARDSHDCVTSFYVAQCNSSASRWEGHLHPTLMLFSTSEAPGIPCLTMQARESWRSTISSSLPSSKALPDSKFQLMKDQLHAKNLDDGIPYFAENLNMMKTYDLSPLVLPFCLPLCPTSLLVPYASIYSQLSSAKTPKSSSTNSCNKKLRDKAIEPNPTDAQIKRAQAVILAAIVHSPLQSPLRLLPTTSTSTWTTMPYRLLIP